MRFARLLSLMSFVVLLTHGPVRAQPSSADRVLATDLFQRGRAALVAGAYAEACPLLEESQRLDPAGGTLLNLALCHEQQGRVATAWSEFLEGLAVARREHREDRIRYAHEHIAALEVRLSRLSLQLGPNGELPGVAVERDGSPLSRSAWGVATPVDPGEHSVRVRAPGYQEHVESVMVKDNGDLVIVSVPALLPEPNAPEVLPKAAPVAIAAPPAAVASKPKVAPHGEPTAARRRRRASIALLALSGAAAVAATVCGGRAIQLRNQAEDNCQDGRCSDAAFEQNDRATRNADASTALAVLSGVSAGGALWLWLLREPSGDQSGERSLHGAGVGLTGRF